MNAPFRFVEGEYSHSPQQRRNAPARSGGASGTRYQGGGQSRAGGGRSANSRQGTSRRGTMSGAMTGMPGSNRRMQYPGSTRGSQQGVRSGSWNRGGQMNRAGQMNPAGSSNRGGWPGYAQSAGQGGRRWGARRRWGWLYPGAYGFDPSGSGTDGGSSDQAVGQAQACLAQLGFQAPQTGSLGPATRRAIRMFQNAQGMPPSGLLDPQTNAALQKACSGPGGGPPPGAGPAATAPPPPPPAAAPDAGPPDAGPPDAGPPEGAAPPDAPPDTGVPDAPSSELGFGSSNSRPAEQELSLEGPCRIEVGFHAAVPVSSEQHLKALPAKAGVYIIYEDGVPWYVGVAERTIRERFLSRRKALHDFHLPLSILSNRSVAWATVTSANAPACVVRRKQEGSTSAAVPVTGANAILKVLEQFFISRMKTNQAGRGNSRGEIVRLSGTGPLSISVRTARGTKDFSFPLRPGAKNQPGIAFDARRQAAG
jgi:peptidoglycan hydrolase-like protein with peptidoglycan-binding domain